MGASASGASDSPSAPRPFSMLALLGYVEASLASPLPYLCTEDALWALCAVEPLTDGCAWLVHQGLSVPTLLQRLQTLPSLEHASASAFATAVRRGGEGGGVVAGPSKPLSPSLGRILSMASDSSASAPGRRWSSLSSHGNHWHTPGAKLLLSGTHTTTTVTSGDSSARPLPRLTPCAASPYLCRGGCDSAGLLGRPPARRLCCP